MRVELDPELHTGCVRFIDIGEFAEFYASKLLRGSCALPLDGPAGVQREDEWVLCVFLPSRESARAEGTRFELRVRITGERTNVPYGIDVVFEPLDARATVAPSRHSCAR